MERPGLRRLQDEPAIHRAARPYYPVKVSSRQSLHLLSLGDILRHVARPGSRHHLLSSLPGGSGWQVPGSGMASPTASPLAREEAINGQRSKSGWSSLAAVSKSRKRDNVITFCLHLLLKAPIFSAQECTSFPGSAWGPFVDHFGPKGPPRHGGRVHAGPGNLCECRSCGGSLCVFPRLYYFYSAHSQSPLVRRPSTTRFPISRPSTPLNSAPVPHNRRNSASSTRN